MRCPRIHRNLTLPSNTRGFQLLLLCTMAPQAVTIRFAHRWPSLLLPSPRTSGSWKTEIARVAQGWGISSRSNKWSPQGHLPGLREAGHARLWMGLPSAFKYSYDRRFDIRSTQEALCATEDAGIPFCPTQLWLRRKPDLLEFQGRVLV